MEVKKETLLPIKKLKYVTMYQVLETGAIIIEKPGLEKIEISKNQIFPILRGLVSATQRFYRKKK